MISRREFVAANVMGFVSVLSAADTSIAAESAIPIIETHTHFYDPTRPVGVPWPAKSEALLYRPVLPAEFKALTKPFGITGTIIVEASPWLEDNQWLLDLAQNDPFIVGIVGNLSPGTDLFAQQLSRFAKNPLFRGIRISATAIHQQIDQQQFVSDLKRMVDHDLELDVNGGPEMSLLVDQLAQKLPQLRIVINHLANLKIDGQSPPLSWKGDLKSAAKHQNVYLKVSALVESARVNGKAVPQNLSHYRPVLQAAWETFGVDRLIFGSNWPVSDLAAPYGTVFHIVSEFFQEQGADAIEKFFARNAQEAYRWKIRR